MESKKKKINMEKIKEKLMDIFLTEEGKQIIKDHKELSKEEKKKLRIQRICWTLIVIVLLIVSYIALYYFQDLNKNIIDSKEEAVIETKPKNEPKTIYSGELTKYMIDDLNNIYLKIAYTKLGDNVAYSVTYNYDIIPQGELSYTKYFTRGDLTSIFINGYPYLSYEEMGLKSEEEAYIATQLAIYEVISRKQLEGISNGTFSLDMISASESQYEDMVNRVVTKAKEIADYAIENVYETGSSASVDLDNVEFDHVSDTETIVGPIYIHSENDEYVKKVYGEDLKEYSDIELKSYFEDNTCTILDKDMKEITQVDSEEPFYIKINRT